MRRTKLARTAVTGASRSSGMSTFTAVATMWTGKYSAYSGVGQENGDERAGWVLEHALRVRPEDARVYTQESEGSGGEYKRSKSESHICGHVGPRKQRQTSMLACTQSSS